VQTQAKLAFKASLQLCHTFSIYFALTCLKKRIGNWFAVAVLKITAYLLLFIFRVIVASLMMMMFNFGVRSN
jgi:hypothetical protein